MRNALFALGVFALWTVPAHGHGTGSIPAPDSIWVEPGAPEDFIDLAWTPVPDADSYQIFHHWEEFRDGRWRVIGLAGGQQVEHRPDVAVMRFRHTNKFGGSGPFAWGVVAQQDGLSSDFTWTANFYSDPPVPLTAVRPASWARVKAMGRVSK